MADFSTCLVAGGLLALAGAASAQSVSFASYASYSMGPPAGPVAIAVADVNNDGKPDLLTANTYNDTAGVLLGNGNGTFPATATTYPAGGTSPVGIAVADVNGDAKPDLLVANSGSNTVGVLKGNGDGTFQAPTLYSTGSTSQPYGVVLADMNGDGRPDLLTPNYGSHKVGVLLSNATGTFQPVIEYTTGTSSGPTSLAVADVNSDGKPDVLSANYPASSVGILLGNGTGNGTLQAPVTHSIVTSQAYGVAVADVTGDGKPDLLLADGSSLVGVMPGNGNGTFQAGSTYPTLGNGPKRVVVADVNRDGLPDLVTANVDGSVSNFSGSSLSVLLGRSSGVFQAATVYGIAGKNYPVGVAVADVSADGRPDLLVAHSQANWVLVFLNTTPLPTHAALPGTSATLAPNPASASTTLMLSGLPATVTQVQATVLDATGRTVGRHALPAAQGNARAELVTAGLAPGLYVVRLAAYDAQGMPAGEVAAQHLSVQ